MQPNRANTGDFWRPKTVVGVSKNTYAINGEFIDKSPYWREEAQQRYMYELP